MLMAYEDKSVNAMCIFSFAIGPDLEPITFGERPQVCVNLSTLFLTHVTYSVCANHTSNGITNNLTQYLRFQGKIVPASGPNDFGWDPVFQPDGYDQT